MKVPTVHLNGTGKKTLLEELENAHRAVGAAIDAVRGITVHGRDYYVQPEPDAYTVARQEMNERLLALDKVQRDIMEMHHAIDRQGR